VLPGADLDALQAVYRRISELSCRAGAGDAAVTVTAACGGVSVPAGKSAEIAAVLAQADALLYQNKRSGRKDFAIESFKAEDKK
jgi:PleD family two-component response regulator